jgi:hypothetical protein
MPDAHPQPHAPDPSDVLALRQLFWHNVVREMLTGLSVMSASGQHKEMFDGRIGVLTHAGERIGIGEVFPMFACGIPGSAAERAASIAVECTVFRIRTPGGEVFTLPLHEIRGMHSLTPELVKQLEQEAMARLAEADKEKPAPFGLAAFTTGGLADKAGNRA